MSGQIEPIETPRAATASSRTGSLTADKASGDGSCNGTPHSGAGATRQTPYSNALNPIIDEDTLARAVLTFLIDSADALLFATIKGAGSASEALHLIDGRIDDRKNQNRLDEAFATGTAQWGRRVSSQGMTAFHNALSRWRDRLRLLPTCKAEVLGDWFTCGGTQWIIGPTSPYWPHQVDDLSIRKDWASPLCLWGYGDPTALTSCAKPLAIVGSRGVNEYGRYVARTVARKAAEQGHLIVSGGAIGTDAAAHWGALEAMGALGQSEAGRTVAVFAGGLRHIGPDRNHELFERIASSGGALVSELCSDTIPEPRRFLLRNRIIAALASTVVVAQARSRSGALNTANWAAELGREVYAAPGNINIPNNTGCNWLIGEQRASILYSVNMVNDICHEHHAPFISDNEQSTKDADPKDVQPGLNLNLTADSAIPSKIERNGPSPHALRPEAMTPATDNEQNGSDSQATSHESHGTATQMEVLGAMRRCRRDRVAVTHEALLQALNKTDETDTDETDGPHSLKTHWSIARLESTLGQMELDDLIELSGGIIKPIKRRE